ncbi:hypothetical protein I3F58_02065 [Streptomyces sp. MUM 203J]|uniref:hypothetical protein n=1 Tax=Streptomyces sp. MUM 203J TaxID=2791990 RepID=UPI001F03B347|nr:hypothetical protein [Streptomyces sp. MUM 203J]MCH0538365.1 hypothetical protein [Streptomyces sp. MUM 203J]
MSNLVQVILWGTTAAGLIALCLVGRGIRTQIEALRAEIAIARIEGVLDKPSPSPATEGPAEPQPDLAALRRPGFPARRTPGSRCNQ